MKNKLISPEAIKLLHYRIEQELLSSAIYKQMSLYFEDIGMTNASKLWSKYSDEEKTHSEWAMTYLLSHNIQPEIPTIEAPESTFTGFEDIVTKTLIHEQEISSQTIDLAKKALDMSDFLLFGLAQKYNNEQTEELMKVYDLVSISKLSKDSLIIDSYIKENFL